MDVGVGFIVAIVYFILAWMFGDAFRDIAEMKGHEGRKYFWWTFILGLVGMMMVIALPDLYARPEKQSVQTGQSSSQQSQSNNTTPKHDEQDDKLPEL